MPMARLIQPKAEAEAAPVADRDLGGPASCFAEFLASIAYAGPALEIVDSATAGCAATSCGPAKSCCPACSGRCCHWPDGGQAGRAGQVSCRMDQ
nr:hypothetical protein [uncultured bacterium]